MELESLPDDGVAWIPSQDLPKLSADFRKLEAVKRGVKVGPSSTANTTKTQPAVKRKREELDAHEAEDEKMHEQPHDQPLAKQRKTLARNIIGVAGARPWKLAPEKRASAGHRSGKSWEAKARPAACYIALGRCFGWHAHALVTKYMQFGVTNGVALPQPTLRSQLHKRNLHIEMRMLTADTTQRGRSFCMLHRIADSVCQTPCFCAHLSATDRAVVLQMLQKRQRQLNQAAAREARQQYKDMQREKREQYEAAKQRKEDNRKKNALKHSVAVSGATARKLSKSKKARKQLMAG